jgi:nucleosome-remodeling factor subunit BPTF
MYLLKNVLHIYITLSKGSHTFVYRESENEMWYYSTPLQFEELLDVLDKTNYEKDLVITLMEFKEDILKHMSITEELTNSHKGNRKSAIEIETGGALSLE